MDRSQQADPPALTAGHQNGAALHAVHTTVSRGSGVGIQTRQNMSLSAPEIIYKGLRNIWHDDLVPGLIDRLSHITASCLQGGEFPQIASF